MAMTNAERQRRYREQREAARRTEREETAPFIRRSFSTFFEKGDSENMGGWEDAEETLAYAGVTLPALATDEWPEFEEYGLQSSGVENRGSISKAEFLAGALHDALSVLTAKLNRFKREEIEARIAELENADLSAPHMKRRALEEIVELKRIKARLAKSVRLTFPAYEIKS